MGIDEVIGYLVVGSVETVTDPTRKTFAKVDIGLAMGNNKKRGNWREHNSNPFVMMFPTQAYTGSPFNLY